MTVSINGTSGIVFNDASAQNTAPKYGMVNRIINGAMIIDQRNVGASVNNGASPSYTLDRWRISGDQASKYSVQQSSTAPTGFSNSLLVTSLSAYTVGTNEQYTLMQRVEGFNFSDLGWGTASAQTVALSFWVRSSLTGTFSGSFRNSSTDRCYPFSYTISVANTWEQKSITVAGDTTGTWIGATNGIGLMVSFCIGGNGTALGTAGAWNSNNNNGATGTTNIVSTSGATFYITGVQLEKGSTATSFDYRPYGTELALCQRYYYKNIVTSDSHVFGCGVNTGTTNATVPVTFLVPMRASPTALETTGTAGNYDLRSASAFSLSGIPTFNTASTFGASVNCSTSGLTAGFASNLRSVTSTAFLAWSAEL